MSTLVDHILPKDIAASVQALADDRRIWIVGGALRDYFLELDQPDLDFAVDRDAISFARSVADALDVPCYILDEQREAARVVLTERSTLDFARLRAESWL